MNDEVDIFLCPRRGWVIRTPMRVPDSALLKMCEHAIETYTKKIATMPDGPHKRLLDATLPMLAKLKVTQEIREPKTPAAQKVAIDSANNA